MNYRRIRFHVLICVLFITAAAHAQYNVTSFIDSLDLPIAFEFAPDSRVFVTQKGTYNTPVSNAQIRVFDAGGNFISTFYDFSDSVVTTGECGLLGLALDPDFATNHFVYTYYIHGFNGDTAFRIVRLTDVNNTGTSPTILFDHPATTHLNAHVAGNLHFRSTEPNNIYFVIGELNDSTNAQPLDRPYGKVLRITKTGGIPTDNPFYDDGNPLTGNDDRIYSYGHRNPFEFCFSPVSDSLYISENGRLAWDEINMGRKGANYGWPACEGSYAWNSTTVACNNPAYTNPIAGFNPTLGITGITYYHSTIMPEFDHHLLLAEFDHHDIYDLTLGNAPFYNTVTAQSVWMPNVAASGLSALHQGPDGCVYAGVLGFYPNGKIIRICSSGVNVAEQPQLLQTATLAPQPFTDETRLSYSLNANTAVTISLFDLSGKLLRTLYNDEQPAGAHQQQIDAGDVPAAGVYFIRISTASEQRVLKLMRM